MNDFLNADLSASEPGVEVVLLFNGMPEWRWCINEGRWVVDLALRLGGIGGAWA